VKAHSKEAYEERQYAAAVEATEQGAVN